MFTHLNTGIQMTARLHDFWESDYILVIGCIREFSFIRLVKTPFLGLFFNETRYCVYVLKRTKIILFIYQFKNFSGVSRLKSCSVGIYIYWTCKHTEITKKVSGKFLILLWVVIQQFYSPYKFINRKINSPNLGTCLL